MMNGVKEEDLKDIKAKEISNLEHRRKEISWARKTTKMIFYPATTAFAFTTSLFVYNGYMLDRDKDNIKAGLRPEFYDAVIMEHAGQLSAQNALPREEIAAQIQNRLPEVTTTKAPTVTPPYAEIDAEVERLAEDRWASNKTGMKAGAVICGVFTGAVGTFGLVMGYKIKRRQEEISRDLANARSHAAPPPPPDGLSPLT